MVVSLPSEDHSAATMVGDGSPYPSCIDRSVFQSPFDLTLPPSGFVEFLGHIPYVQQVILHAHQVLSRANENSRITKIPTIVQKLIRWIGGIGNDRASVLQKT